MAGTYHKRAADSIALRINLSSTCGISINTPKARRPRRVGASLPRHQGLRSQQISGLRIASLSRSSGSTHGFHDSSR